MKIEILGMGCAKCKQLYANVQAAAVQLKLQADITKVEDVGRIASSGVWAMPAIVVDGAVKAAGKVPSVEEIKKLLEK